MRLNKTEVLKENYNLTLKTFKKLNRLDRQDANVLQKLVIFDYANWEPEIAQKFFTKYPKALRYLEDEKQKKFINANTLKYLSKEIQIQVINNDEKMLKSASKKVQAEMILKEPARALVFTIAEQKEIALASGVDYIVIKYLSKDAQKSICNDNVKLIKYADVIVQDKIIAEDTDLFKYGSQDYRFYLADISTYNMSKITKECIRRYTRESQIYSQEIFEKVLNGLYKIHKQRKLIEVLVKYTDINLVTYESLNIFMKCNANKKIRKFRRSKVWKKVKRA